MFRICSKIRLYPTPAQETLLQQSLGICCDVYNSLLNWREYAWETEQKHVSRYDQQAALPLWKKQTDADGALLHPELKTVYAQVLQDVVHRVDLAYSAFFDRIKDYNERKAKGKLRDGEKPPGKPRSKGYGHYDSLSYTQRGFSVGDNSLTLSKIGTVKAIVHRQVEGTLKTCILRRQAGKWFASLCYEVGAEELPPSDEKVGIDVGLEKFAALSNKEFVENPRFFRKDEKALAKAQRKADKLKQARSKDQKAKRRKANRVVARIHERIRNRRHDFVHQTARKLVNRFGLIALEKLNIEGMVKNHCLAKSISDASWGMFREVLTSKAERAGRVVVNVNPAYTSQDCSGCGYRAKKKLSERWHHCPMCGLSLDRDTNSAITILNTAVGQHSGVG